MITILFVHNQILKSHVTFLLQAGIGCVLNYTCKSNLKKNLITNTDMELINIVSPNEI
jgi:hypothetical protein